MPLLWSSGLMIVRWEAKAVNTSSFSFTNEAGRDTAGELAMQSLQRVEPSEAAEIMLTRNLETS